MKTVFKLFAAALTGIFLAASCDYLTDQEDSGRISLSLTGAIFTKATVPDSSLFYLEIKSSGGEKVYSGRYGDAPQTFKVSPGSYSVAVWSAVQEKPQFENPVYGDSQVVQVATGETVNVALECTLQNCGVKLLIDSSFLTAVPDGALVLKNSEGSLAYAYREQRTAYFRPGEVSLVLTRGAQDKVLATKTLAARDMLRLKVLANQTSSSGISVQTDTTANWIDDTYVIGGDTQTTVYDVYTARDMVGQKDVWVYGYIVGCISPFGSSSYSATNLAIAGRTSVSDKASCMSVELKKGALRDALNLVDHPENLGRKVFVKGDIVTYYSVPGVKNITDWSLDVKP